jgi:hypothetical protein
MTTPTLAEQAATLVSESFKDGEPSDGAPTAEEQAAHEADQALRADTSAAGAEVDKDDDLDEGAEGGVDNSGEKDPASETEKDDAAGAASSQAKAGKGKDTAKRIGDLTANWRSEERRANTEKERADNLQRQLDALKNGSAKPLTSPGDTDKSVAVPPDPAAFEYGELDTKYIAALARHEAKQALAAEKADQETARQAAAADAQRQEAAEKQDRLVRAGLELHDDFDEVVMQGAREGRWDLSPHLGPLLLDSEFGAQITYDLAKDPAEAARVARLPATDQAKWLGRQEAKLEAAKSSQAGGKPPPKAPQAPPPPKTPRGNSGQFRVGADSQDFAAVERAFLAGELR